MTTFCILWEIMVYFVLFEDVLILLVREQFIFGERNGYAALYDNKHLLSSFNFNVVKHIYSQVGNLLPALAIQFIINPENLYTNFTLIYDVEQMRWSLQQKFMCLEIKMYKTKQGKNFHMASVVYIPIKIFG